MASKHRCVSAIFIYNENIRKHVVRFIVIYNNAIRSRTFYVVVVYSDGDFSIILILQYSVLNKQSVLL